MKSLLCKLKTLQQFVLRDPDYVVHFPLHLCPLRLAYFCAEDTFGQIGTLVRSLMYLVMYYTFAQPRAAALQMYLVTVAIVYCCSGTAYFLSQVSLGLCAVRGGICGCHW